MFQPDDVVSQFSRANADRAAQSVATACLSEGREQAEQSLPENALNGNVSLAASSPITLGAADPTFGVVPYPTSPATYNFELLCSNNTDEVNAAVPAEDIAMSCVPQPTKHMDGAFVQNPTTSPDHISHDKGRTSPHNASLPTSTTSNARKRSAASSSVDASNKARTMSMPPPPPLSPPTLPVVATCEACRKEFRSPGLYHHHMENNICRALASSNETDTTRNGNGANSPVLVVKNPQAKHAPFKYTPQYHVGSIPEATQEPDKKYRAQHQQFRLFHDERRYQLFKEYKLIEERVPNTHCADMSDASRHIIEHGLPARVWTVGSEGSERVGFPPDAKSEFGPCDCAYDEADYLLLTEKEHNTWASYQHNRPKPVVLRDQEFNRRRPGRTTNKWMKEMMRFASSNELLVDVQLLNKKDSSIAVEKIPLRQAITDWRKTQGRAHIDEENMPMNLLNISDIKPGHWPEGLSKNYPLLFDAIERCDGLIYQDLHPEGETELGIGKPGTLVYSHCDIQKCAQFRILAQRGAMSSWHIDNLGVYTFVHLEGNTGDDDEQDEDVVKYWPIFPLHHLTEEAKQEALADFAKPLMKGGSTKWRPKPKEGIRVISLTRGDMLIQPPGTIHAPITLTDCFFLGGMAWKRSTMKQTMTIWEYLARNEDCTNENLPRQAQAILEYLQNEVKESPSDFNLDTDEERENFQRQCDFIYSMVGRCYCKTPCYKNATCSCRLRKVKCGARCHKNGQQKKANPDSKTCLDHPNHAAKPKPKPKPKPKSKSSAKPQPEPEVENEEFEPEAAQAEKPKRPHKEKIEEDYVLDTQSSKSRKINHNSTPASITSDASTALPRKNEPCEKCRSDTHNTNYLGPNGRTLCRRCNKDWMADGRDPDWKGVRTRAHQSENSSKTAVAKQRHENVGERLLRENTLVRLHSPGVENPLRREKRRRDLGFLNESSSREPSAEPTEHDKPRHCSGCDKTRTHEWHDFLPNQENGKGDPEYQGKSWCNKCYHDNAKAMVDLETKIHEYEQRYSSGSKLKARGADTAIDLAPMVPPSAHKPSAPSISKDSRNISLGQFPVKINGIIEQHVMDGLPRLVWKGKGNEPCRGCGTITPLQGWHGGMGGHCKPCYHEKGKILDAYTPPGCSALRTVLTSSAGAALGQSTQSNGTLKKQDGSKESQSSGPSRPTFSSSATGATKDMTPATGIRRVSGPKESTESNPNGFRKSTQFITIDDDSSPGFQGLEGAERPPATELTNTAEQEPPRTAELRQAGLAINDVQEEPMNSGDQVLPVASTKSHKAKLAGPCCKCGSKEHRKGFRDHIYQEEPSTTGDQWCFKCYDSNYRKKRTAQKLRLIQADEPGDVIMTDSRLGQRPALAREDTGPVKSEDEEVMPMENPAAKKRFGVKATGPCCVCNDATAAKYAVSLYNEDSPADGRQWCKRCYDRDYKAKKNGREPSAAPSGVKIRLGSNAKEILSREPSETPLIQPESPTYHGAAFEPGISLKRPRTEEGEPNSNPMRHKKAADKAPTTNWILQLPNNRDSVVSIGEQSCVKCQNTFNKPDPWHSHLLGEPDLADGGVYCHPCYCKDGTKACKAKKWDEAQNNGNSEQGNAPNDTDKTGAASPLLPANPLGRKRSSAEYGDDADAEDEQEPRVQKGRTYGGKPSESFKGKYSEQKSETRVVARLKARTSRRTANVQLHMIDNYAPSAKGGAPPTKIWDNNLTAATISRVGGSVGVSSVAAAREAVLVMDASAGSQPEVNAAAREDLSQSFGGEIAIEDQPDVMQNIEGPSNALAEPVGDGVDVPVPGSGQDTASDDNDLSVPNPEAADKDVIMSGTLKVATQAKADSSELSEVVEDE